VCKHINLNSGAHSMTSKKQSDDSRETSSQQGGSRNFANDPQRASEAGKKGGQHSHSGSQHQAEDSKSGGSQHGGSSDVANDREKASEAGKKGAEHSHGKR
jgi:general stress protein YciG